MTHHLSIRVGSATVDVSLAGPLRAGESVEATVELRGGARAEVLENLGLHFRVGDENKPMRRPIRGATALAGQVRIHAADHRTVATRLEVPETVPVSLDDTVVEAYLRAKSATSRSDPESAPHIEPQSRETVPSASRGPSEPAKLTKQSDSSNLDRSVATDGGTVGAAGPNHANTGPARSIEIRPGNRLSLLLDALSALGFFLESATPLPAPEAETNGLGAEPTQPTQALEFKPRWGPYADLDPIVCELAPIDEQLEVRIRLADSESDAGGDSENRDSPPRYGGRLTVRNTDRYAVRADLEALLETF